MMSKSERIKKTSNEIVHFLSRHQTAASTVDVSQAMNVSLYQARYYLRKLASDGVVEEINHGKGVSSRWRFRCRH